LELKKLDAENFSEGAFSALIDTFTTQELKKNLASLVSKIPEEEVKKLEKKYFKNLNQQKVNIKI
jgi:aryl-alcohol dehydrogenase-like predicted oxidoreductase